MNGYGDVADTEHTPDAEHNKHRDRRVSGTAEHSCHTVGKCQHKIKQRYRPRLHDTETYHLRVAVKRCDKGWRSRINRESDQLCDDHRAEHAKPRALLRTVVLLRTEILAYKRSQCHRKAGDRKECKSFDLRIGTAARHRHFPKRIDIALHENIGDCDNGILEAGRDTVLDDLSEHLAVDFDFFQLKLVFFLRPHKLDHTQASAHKLRDGGC